MMVDYCASSDDAKVLFHTGIPASRSVLLLLPMHLHRAEDTLRPHAASVGAYDACMHTYSEASAAVSDLLFPCGIPDGVSQWTPEAVNPLACWLYQITAFPQPSVGNPMQEATDPTMHAAACRRPQITPCMGSGPGHRRLLNVWRGHVCHTQAACS